jgi:protein SCO1
MTETAATEPAQAPSAGARGKLLALGLAALLLTIAPTLVRGLLARPRPEVYGHLPSFHLVNEQGAPVTDAALLGHVTVVDFIFTRCPSSCPRLTARMGELQNRLAQSRSSARLVSITVDPENDTPPVLAAYASRAHADPSRWSFLTGSAQDVQNVVVSGFKVAASRQARGAGDYDVIHGDWFVLVDARGDIRGYFTTSEPKDLDALVQAIGRV